MTERLHDEILRDLSPDFVRRMENWARSLDGSSVTTCSSIWGNVGGGSFEARIPTLMGEAEDTDKIIKELPHKYQVAVKAFWGNRSRTLGWMCESIPRLRLWCVTPPWLTDWLERGHSMMRSHVARKKGGVR